MSWLLEIRSLFWSWEGRIARARYLGGLAVLGALFMVLRPIADLAGPYGVPALDVVILIASTALTVKRLHDRGHSARWLFVFAIPLLGPLFLAWQLFFRKGTPGENHYGDDPLRDRTDYLRVENLEKTGPANATSWVEEVTRLYPTPVFAVTVPESVDDVIAAVKRTDGPLSIGGGRFSMGGQVASPDSLHLDMRKMNRVLALDLANKRIRVQAGIRWCDIQRVVDPHDLSVKIMQSYANFTVGGSLSVNVHGRYVGLGPLILSVRSIDLVLASGERVHASREENREIFFGAVGGYGALGVIVEAELELADNTRVERVHQKLPAKDYVEHFKKTVRDAKEAVFHNADLYAPHYSSLRSTTWVKTKRPVTHSERLMPTRTVYPLERYFSWAVSETPFGAWRREYLMDPMRLLFRAVHWRNYEAGYNVAELEPPTRKHRTYVLQEYFVPIAKFEPFLAAMGEILRRHEVNMLNISVRHALPDDGSLLAWAPEEVFAFVLYYKQRTRQNARDRVAVWTRELMEAVLQHDGRWYLPYQAHATESQFHRAYPKAKELFALKKRLDPDFRFRNVLWNQYYTPWLASEDAQRASAPAVVKSASHAELPKSEFHAVWQSTKLRDGFYRFLQNVYHLYPEDRFHTLIGEGVRTYADDETIYRFLQEKLPDIKPALGDATYALPSLAKQKAEMARQTTEIVGARRGFDGYLEVGTPGRYVAHLRESLELRGTTWLVNDVEPGNGPVDVVERGGLAKVGTFVPMNDYEPIPESAIATGSCELVTCFIGLHHIEPSKLDPFVRSIVRVLKDGGLFVLRDHDVTSLEMDRFVALAHTVFNAGLMAPWKVNADERRHFAPIATWVERLAAHGLVDSGKRLLQENDPSDNTLLCFEKKPQAEATP